MTSRSGKEAAISLMAAAADETLHSLHHLHPKPHGPQIQQLAMETITGLLIVRTHWQICGMYSKLGTPVAKILISW